MMRLPALAQSASEDLLSKLLGIDRISLEDGQIGLDWHHRWPLWAIVLVVIPLIVGGVGFLYRHERKDVRWGPKLFLTLLRSAILFLVFLLLLGPILIVDVNKARKSYVLVLIDDSLSMKKADPPNNEKQKLALGRLVRLTDGTAGAATPELDAALKSLTRADIVKRVLENPELRLLDSIEEKLNIAYFTFSKGARSIEGKEPKESREKFFKAYDPKQLVGTETAIGDSIRQAVGMYKGLPVAAVVVFSDGRNNFGIQPSKIAEQLGRRRIPVYTVLAGIPQKPRDIALLELEAQQAVLVNDKLPIRFGVRGEGYAGTEVSVNLHVHAITDPAREYGLSPQEIEGYLQESRIEGEKKIALDGSGRQSGDIVWQPRTPGEYLLLLRVPPHEDERTDLNNTLLHRVRVADDKIKVLYVEHPPRYEYRFLKNALIRDSKILAHCFLTSADEDFPQEHTKDAADPDFRQPLKEFPSTLKELLKYDVLVFGDVDPSVIGGRATWENIEKFVANFGGGVVFISGVMNNPRAFRDTPLANLLPVIPEDARPDSDQVYDRPFGYKLTPEALDAREGKGGGHPIIMFPSIGNDLKRTEELWEDRDGKGDGLPGIFWYQRVARVKPGAKVLVELTGHPQGDASGKRPPLFVTQHYGDGRVFWSATDDTWRWRYLAGDSPWFYPFWQQAIYWTRYGKLLGTKRYRIRLDRHDRRYMIGDDVTFFVTAFDNNFEPLKDKQLEIYVEPPRGVARIPIELTKEKDRDGYYQRLWKPLEVGTYRVWAGDPNDESSRSIEKFTVYVPNREEDEPRLDEEELRAIAHASHARASEKEPPKPEGPRTEDHAAGACPNFVSLETIDRLPAILSAKKNDLRERKEDDLWDSPLVYIVFGLLITTEWVLRKVWRML